LLESDPLKDLHLLLCLEVGKLKILSSAGSGNGRLEFRASEKLVGAMPTMLARSEAVHPCFDNAFRMAFSRGDASAGNLAFVH